MVNRVGFIGLGRMGRPMACNLQKRGFDTTGFDLNPDAAAALVAMGGRRAESIAQVASQCEVIFTMLPTSDDVRKVIEADVVPHAKGGTLVVDMSTIDPVATDAVAVELAKTGLRFADAPVGRLAAHADRGECLFMVGATAQDFGTLEPMLRAMGTTIHHCGGVGAGIRMKVVNNYLAVASCQLNAEALTLATRFGLNLEMTIEVLNGTTASNGHLKTNFPFKVLMGDLEPGFQIDLAHKDLGVALKAASAMRVPLSMGSTARECLQLARSRGYGRMDFSALLDSWCALADVIPPRLKKRTADSKPAA